MAVGRLYTKGRALGHARGKRNTHPDTTIVALEGVATKEEAKFYLGKRVAYVYRGSKPINGSKVRVLWGKVTRSHGSTGKVKVQFRRNLPPKAFGATVRVLLYPSTI